MSSDKYVLGIDLGTSYVKTTVMTSDGEPRDSVRTPSPLILKDQRVSLSSYRNAFQWLVAIKRAMSQINPKWKHDENEPLSICVSGITPELTIFDSSAPEKALSIPYSERHSVMSKYSEDQVSRTLWRRKCTEITVGYLDEVARAEGWSRPLVTDLVGYITWCLTGSLTINPIAMFELGLVCNDSQENIANSNFPLPVCAPCNNIVGSTVGRLVTWLGLGHSAVVCCGCSDSVASAVGAGLRKAGQKMIYLGTYGSLMSLDVDLDEVLSTETYLKDPYSWLVSVPDLGPSLETLSSKWFKQNLNLSPLCQLDAAAAVAPPGANGNVYTLPWLDQSLSLRGEMNLLSSAEGDEPTVQDMARGVLEALGYIIHIQAQSELSTSLFAAGGGASSLTWLQILSQVIERTIIIAEGASEATGSCKIALSVMNGEFSLPSKLKVEFDIKNTEVIHNNIERLRERYLREESLS